MRVSVVDASALGALVFTEPRAREVAQSLSETVLVAPSLLWFELASTCLEKMKAHPDPTQQLAEAFRLSRRLPIETVDIDHAEVIELAAATGLTSYDTSYLWLARKVAGELVTLDARLRKAMSRVEP